MESGKVEVKVGDFVEAVFVADQTLIRRGVVIDVLGPITVVVKGWDWESICDNPIVIPATGLSAKDKDLINWVFRGE
jgi:hypothetical protein